MAALFSRSLRNCLLGHHLSLQHPRIPFPSLTPPRCSSSTMSTPRFLYQMVDEDVERLEHYRPGGYHPIKIGQRLHDRYRIVHKLGYGSFSTIWLAQDEHVSKYVAVKVCTADASQKEVDTLSRLSAVTGASPTGTDRETLVPSILDRFTIQGPNGTHPCLVTVPARCSLADTKEASSSCLFQVNIARSLAAQLALAIAHIHDQGLVHGDLHLGNILLQLPHGLDALSESQLYDKYGAPKPEPVIRIDGKPLLPGVPSHIIPPVWFGEPCESITLSEARITLSDFGVAFWPLEEARRESYTPLDIRPPEARFEPAAISFASDVWSLGCTIWALVSHRSLFDASFLATDDDVTAQQVDVLGPLPAEWWAKWEGRSKEFTETGQAIEGRCVWTWDRRFEEWVQHPRRDKGMAALDEKEAEAFSAMIRWMLAFRPEDRPSAAQVLETEWMRDWALPDVEKTRL